MNRPPTAGTAILAYAGERWAERSDAHQCPGAAPGTRTPKALGPLRAHHGRVGSRRYAVSAAAVLSKKVANPAREGLGLIVLHRVASVAHRGELQSAEAGKPLLPVRLTADFPVIA